MILGAQNIIKSVNEKLMKHKLMVGFNRQMAVGVYWCIVPIASIDNVLWYDIILKFVH